MMKKSIYDRITQQVTQNLEKAGSWQKLWQTPQPISLNEHKYRGINHLLLSSEDYSSPVWGTFNQVRKNGGQVNRGEKSHIVVFWKKLQRETTDPLTGEKENQVRFMLRYYSVFNTEQCTFDDIGLKKIESLSGSLKDRHNELYMPAEHIVDGMPERPDINIGLHHTPCYIPSLDQVQMPDIKYFTSSEAFYAAMYHELVHSTGAKHRLNRFEADQFKSEASYSKEELVAELGASYLCAMAGIQPNIENAAAYLKSWLKVLEDNPTWIVWAAGKAQKACEFIVPAEVPQEVPF
jgi:antirestriction protein ArdC